MIREGGRESCVGFRSVMEMADGRHRRCLDADVINTLMLRFRPIAPKPVTGEPRKSPVDSIGKARSKRKYVGRRRTGGRDRNRRSELAKPDTDQVAKTHTMQLVPVKAEEPSKVANASEGWPGAYSYCDSSCCSLLKSWREDEGTPCPGTPQLPDLNTVGSPYPRPDLTVVTAQPRHKRVLETWLIVESIVTDARCTRGVGWQQQQQQLGRAITDEERLKGLVGNTCPGFVTDVDNLIRWANGACERMVRERLTTVTGGGVAAVWMVAREELPYSCPAFTCRVRITYTWQDECCPMGWQGPRSITVAPCDAWRLESGGFAWRLDVEAALTLGL